MNTGTLVFGVIAVLAVGGAAIALTRDEDEPPEETGPELPPLNNIPPGALPPISGAPYQWPAIPPSDFPIIGGQYVDSINKWCPPGYLYNGNTGMCEALQSITLDPGVIFQPVNLTQGNGDEACCDSCAAGGPCTGCEND